MKIKFCAYTVNIEEVHGAVTDDDTKECFGTWSINDLRIRVECDRPPGMILSTYFHELVEMINRFYGIDLGHPQIAGVSEGLAEAFSRNPALVDRLLELSAAIK